MASECQRHCFGAMYPHNECVYCHLPLKVILLKLMCLYYIIKIHLNFRGESLLPGSVKLKLLIILQGTLGAITFIAALSCVSYMQVPDALCIIFACPVVTIAASAIMLRDKINLAKILAGIFLLLGVVLACKPPFLFNVIEKLDLSVGNHKEVRFILDFICTYVFMYVGCFFGYSSI